MLASIFVLFQVIGLLSSVHAILQTRTPQGAIAWAVSLNALPIVAVPTYWVFGRSKFNGYVNAWRDVSAEAKPHYLEHLSIWERLKARGSALLSPVL